MYNRVVDRRNMRVALFAGILLACLLLVATLYNSAFAQENGTIMYPENGTDAVATFTAVGPGGRVDRLVVGRRRRDNDNFDIENGCSHSRIPPTLRPPRGGTSGNSNTYVVTVGASDGGEPRPLLKK